MLLRPYRLLALLILAMGLVAVACGDDGYGGSDNKDSSDKTATRYAPATDEPTATTEQTSSGGDPIGAVEALQLSTERSEQVDSFQGTFTMSMNMGVFDTDMRGDYRYEAPDRFYMTMDFMGEQFEAIMRDRQFYMRMPGEGWFGGSLDELGVDYDELLRYAEQHGPIDYKGFIESLGDVAQLPDETIDGQRYLHYRGEVSMQDAMDDLPDDLFDPSLLGEFGDVFQPMTIDVLLFADTYLPYKVDVDMTFNIPATVEDVPEDLGMSMSMVMTDYNEPVTIPEPPTDYQPLPALNDVGG